jgi:iron complex outermembrane receptor protein
VRQRNLAGYVSTKWGFTPFGKDLLVVLGTRFKLDTLATGYNINTAAGTFAPVAFTGSHSLSCPAATCVWRWCPTS